MKRILFVLLLLIGFAWQLHSAHAAEKVLVIYYSRTGNTRKVAERLEQRFNADIERIIDQKKRIGPIAFVAAGKDALAGNLTEIAPLKVNPLDYDLILVGTPSWYSNMTPAVRTLLTQYDLSDKQVGVFATAHLTGVETTVKKVAEFIQPDTPEAINQLPLYERDLDDEVLDEKIEKFYSLFKLQLNPDE